MSEKNRTAPPGFTWPENMESPIRITDEIIQAAKEIAEDSRENAEKEKREISGIFDNELGITPRQQLKLEIMKLALECNDPLKDAEQMYQWITKPE